MLWIKMGFLAGIFIASPLILWQVWKFIAPGLYSHEKKYAIPFVLMSTFFFVLGGLFAHYIAFPVTWAFFGSFATDYMLFVPKIDEAFSLYSKMILGAGLIFEMPTLVLFLARMGVVSGRMMLKYFRVRLPGDLHHCRRDQPGHRRGVAAGHGGADGGPLPAQHRDCLRLPEAPQAGHGLITR